MYVLGANAVLGEMSGLGRSPGDSECGDTRFSRRMLDSIDRFVRYERHKPIRTEAVRRILHDWLGAHGYASPSREGDPDVADNGAHLADQQGS